VGALFPRKKVLTDQSEKQLEDFKGDLGQLLQEAQYQVQKATIHDPLFQERGGAKKRPELVHHHHRRLLPQEPRNHLH
jgi:hypothetical protein